MMQADSAKQVDLAALTVRPVRDAQEQAERGRLTDTHHYPECRGMAGGGLRHVAETPDGGNRWTRQTHGEFAVG